MPTKQETFDAVVSHLRKQRRKAEDSRGCCYRVGGLKCAAGALIPDDMYDPYMETAGVCLAYVNDESKLATKVLIELGHDIDLVNRLQRIHDQHNVSEWEWEFRTLARNEELTYTPPVAQPEAAQ